MSISETIKSNKKILFYIFIAAFLLRAIYLLFLMSVAFDINVLNQDFEYGIIARSLIAGKGYSTPIIEQSGWQEPKKELNINRPTAYHLPFYPIMLAMIYYFVKNPLSILIVMCIQVVFASATCIVIYLIALKLFINQRIAIIAGCIMILYPTSIAYVARLVPETILTFWLSLAVLYLLLLKDNPSYRNSLITGALIGVTLLTTNVVVPMIPFIFMWLLISLTIAWEKRFKIIMLTMITAFIIVSPWIIRNYIVFKEFPLMKTTMGLNFWLGNNPKATGTFYLQSGEIMDSILPKVFYEGYKFSETEQDKQLYYEAMAYIKKNPVHFVRLFLKKIFYFTWFPPDNLLTKEAKLHRKLIKLPYGFILISCIFGVILSLRKYPKGVFLIFSIILSETLLFAIFVVGHPRYRMTIEPYIIIFSSYTISFLLDRFVSHVKEILERSKV